MFPVYQFDQKIKRRGRPCASERHNNELLEKRLTSLIHSEDEFTKSNIMPFIVKRQRRVRANDRERNRMQTLNDALNELKDHLPIDFLVSELGSDLDNSGSIETNGKKNKKKSNEEKLTKIDTLKLATKYIRLLTDILNEENASDQNTVYTSSSGSSPVSPNVNFWHGNNDSRAIYAYKNQNYQNNFSYNTNQLNQNGYFNCNQEKFDYHQNGSLRNHGFNHNFTSFNYF